MKKALARTATSIAFLSALVIPAPAAHATTCSAADPNVEAVVCTVYGAASQISCRYLSKYDLCLR